MTKSIEETVLNCASELFGLDLHRIRLDQKLGDDLGVDSLDVVELIMDIEKKLKILIDDRKITTLNTLNDICLIIKEQLD
jgi:acyl carrier protein